MICKKNLITNLERVLTISRVQVRSFFLLFTASFFLILPCEMTSSSSSEVVWKRKYIATGRMGTKHGLGHTAENSKWRMFGHRRLFATLANRGACVPISYGVGACRFLPIPPRLDLTAGHRTLTGSYPKMTDSNRYWSDILTGGLKKKFLARDKDSIHFFL